MFIVDVEYKVSLDKIDEVLAEHRSWLDIYFQKGMFLLSGPKNPRTGGIIIAKANSKQELEDLFKNDPYALKNVAIHTVHEFKAINTHSTLSSLIEN